MNTRVLWFGVSIAPIILLIVILALSLLNDPSRIQPGLINATSGPATRIERDLPRFELNELTSGTLISAETFPNAILLIDFWSSWCPPCQAEAITLASVYGEYKAFGIEFVGIAVWDDTSAIKEFMRKFESPYPMLIDQTGRTAVDFGITGVPEKFFVDTNGVIRYQVRGPMTPDDLRVLLDDLLATRGIDSLEH
jgi:cytochrome c biogenesis protein CcmG/thiol:disulfide interchange protein DsbE